MSKETLIAAAARRANPGLVSVTRSRYFGQVDTGLWPNFDLAMKGVQFPESLSFEERAAFNTMVSELGLTDPYPI
jgi:hypothetical protein